MTDKWLPEQRSRMMSRVKSTDTKPEMQVRKTLHRLGYRYRLHDRKLPGKPDIVLARHKKIIFVHGCFWHGHNCPKGSRPTSRIEFWNEKLDRNIERDSTAQAKLLSMGWSVLVVWECQTKNDQLEKLLTTFMNDNGQKVKT